MYTDVIVLNIILFLFCGFISLFLCEMKKTEIAKVLMSGVLITFVMSGLFVGIDYLFF